jgi:hypothetical protein
LKYQSKQWKNPRLFGIIVLQTASGKERVFTMSIISQISMFSWENEIEVLGDLKRLKLVLENMPDEIFMRKLENERGNGRNEYPVRAMWNALIAMIVLGHPRFADLIRELRRNVQLRYMCGFECLEKVPGPDNMSRFVAKLEIHGEDIMSVFVELSEMLYELLPDFGESLALDSKWVWSSANRRSARKEPDGRSETDAEWGRKDYSGTHEDGKEWSKTLKCFGFKMHVLVDAKYELPVAFISSGANGSDIVYGKKLLEQIEKDRPYIIQRCRYFTADRAYDDTPLILWLKGKGVKAIIDKRKMWREENEKELPRYPRRYYNETGEIFCYSEHKSERHRMIPAGYDAERDTLRMKCPVGVYGATCVEAGTCTLCKNIRVKLGVDERIFTQVDRTSYKWKTLYRSRTAVERVNSRLDVSFGFEARRVRGMKKMSMLTALAFAVMDTLAVGSIRAGRPERMRSLVHAA